VTLLVRNAQRGEQALRDLRAAVPGAQVETLEKIPGASFSTKTLLTERMEEVMSGARAQVVVQVFGDDLDVIDQKAQDVLRLVAARA